MSIPTELKDFDIEPVLDEIERVGAVSIPILTDDSRLSIMEEIKDSYRAGLHFPDLTWKSNTDYVLSVPINYHYPQETRVGSLLKDFNNHLIQKLKVVSPYPFESPLNLGDFTDIFIYNPGSKGIPFHQDAGDNLRAIFMIYGVGKFSVCDGNGTNAVEIATTPGNVILMRAPGFRGTRVGQKHFVSEIKTSRYVIATGQYVPEYHSA